NSAASMICSIISTRRSELVAFFCRGFFSWGKLKPFRIPAARPICDGAAAIANVALGWRDFAPMQAHARTLRQLSPAGEIRCPPFVGLARLQASPFAPLSGAPPQ